MTLREKQSKFLRLLAGLIMYADQNGYELTLPAIGLGIDLKLFKGGKNLTDHLPIGKRWEFIGGTWDNGCHYSLEHGGRK